MGKRRLLLPASLNTAQPSRAKTESGCCHSRIKQNLFIAGNSRCPPAPCLHTYRYRKGDKPSVTLAALPLTALQAGQRCQLPGPTGGKEQQDPAWS